MATKADTGLLIAGLAVLGAALLLRRGGNATESVTLQEAVDIALARAEAWVQGEISRGNASPDTIGIVGVTRMVTHSGQPPSMPGSTWAGRGSTQEKYHYIEVEYFQIPLVNYFQVMAVNTANGSIDIWSHQTQISDWGL